MAEIALAMLVLSVGLLAVIGLFSAGLATNKTAVDDTQVALFAEEVLNAVAAEATLITNTWGPTMFNSIEVRAPAYTQWDTNTLQDLAIEFNRLRTNTYVTAQERIEDYAVTYSLRVRPVSRDGQSASGLLALRLDVASGEVRGPATENRVFYREIFDTRK